MQMIKRLTIAFILFTVVLLSGEVFALQVDCQVKRILDGDTFHCLVVQETLIPGIKYHRDGSITVRMRGIDAPEKRQHNPLRNS